MASQNYRDLEVWRRAMDLAVAVYEVTRELPEDERFGLRAQLRRASVSIASNIAEGQGRGSDAEFLRFLSIAYGSLREVETQIILCERLRFLTQEVAEAVLLRAGEVGRLLNGLRRHLASRKVSD